MNRVAIDLGFIQIYWYSICILLGMTLGMLLVFREAKKKKIKEATITDLVFWTVIFGVIGARLYFVLFNLNYYSNHISEIFEIWNGGLAIHGGILAGSLYLIYFAKRRKLSILKLTDICAPGLIAGQMIGRWGNFFNAEVYGAVVGKKALESMHLPKFIIEGMYIKEKGDYCAPLFLYESIWNLIGLIILIIIRRFKYIKEGQITGFYLVWYSAGRFVIEGMRDKEYNLTLGGLKVAQIVSIILGITGLVLIWFRFKKGKFEYLYNDNREDLQLAKPDIKIDDIVKANSISPINNPNYNSEFKSGMIHQPGMINNKETVQPFQGETSSAPIPAPAPMPAPAPQEKPKEELNVPIFNQANVNTNYNNQNNGTNSNN